MASKSLLTRSSPSNKYYEMQQMQCILSRSTSTSHQINPASTTSI
jgi:hypothetical protein